MYYVYILRSFKFPKQAYIGYTTNLKTRLNHHNHGSSSHTSKYRPWDLEWYCAFPDKGNALDFEIYRKSHSGKAFLHKRLIEN
ncbi:MAG: GIY-YIG nuclease family protein [Acidobacteria bacterium]|nr:GIY-YIG nuclease family protein [Acidobacteriota bacterium]